MPVVVVGGFGPGRAVVPAMLVPRVDGSRRFAVVVPGERVVEIRRVRHGEDEQEEEELQARRGAAPRRP